MKRNKKHGEVLRRVHKGSEYECDFYRNKSKDGNPVCYINHMICFIDDQNKLIVKPGSTWAVKVDAIFGTHLVVTPVYMIRSAEANEKKLEEKLDKIHSFAGKVTLENLKTVLV
jgi:hypothetical protein